MDKNNFFLNILFDIYNKKDRVGRTKKIWQASIRKLYYRKHNTSG